MDTREINFGILFWAAFCLSFGVPCVKDGKAFMTYTINNEIQAPMFEKSMELQIAPNKNLIYYMEQSVLTNPSDFKTFTATFSSPYGYFIQSINGVAGNWVVNQTYWEILNQDGPLQVGVSTYFPKAGDRRPERSIDLISE